LTEDRLDIADGRPTDGELDAVPVRSRPIDSRHRPWLRIAPMRGVVAAAVTQVARTQKGDVQLGPITVPQDHELLVG
jgi:hypothetical protein